MCFCRVDESSGENKVLWPSFKLQGISRDAWSLFSCPCLNFTALSLSRTNYERLQLFLSYEAADGGNIPLPFTGQSLVVAWISLALFQVLNLEGCSQYTGNCQKRRL